MLKFGDRVTVAGQDGVAIVIRDEYFTSGRSLGPAADVAFSGGKVWRALLASALTPAGTAENVKFTSAEHEDDEYTAGRKLRVYPAATSPYGIPMPGRVEVESMEMPEKEKSEPEKVEEAGVKPAVTQHVSAGRNAHTAAGDAVFNFNR